jgi:hypothetical protein
MEIKRQLGISYPTAWKVKRKLVQAMKERDGQYLLRGIIHVDDAYFGGELNGGKAGPGSEIKVPFVAALELNEEGRPIHIKMDLVSGFTSEPIKTWTSHSVEPGSVIFSDDLACFRATAEAGCEHVAKVIGGRKPKDVPIFQPDQQEDSAERRSRSGHGGQPTAAIRSR